ncbi:Amino acid transporter [Amycolatopsis arida]|uniref:Amino acid transporter n=1 Tax=Amycolatopsis arida TaxID=587909 RepID=A0A1I5QC99_9PSEU|nr:APC family permease [Amycolatopsis arida]TDX98790.1 amino acid transporter [Amycolatopsis arida]SFP43938.1 Amino acid transporter [Amycolatopsis arida]
MSSLRDPVRSAARPDGSSAVSTALAADRLGAPAIAIFVMSAATPLTVVAGVVTTGYAETGLVGVPLAFAVIAVVLAVFSVGYIAMARHVAHAGAFYAYVSRGLSRPLGVGSAWMALLAYNALQVGLYGLIGAATQPLLAGWFGVELPWWVIALAAWALVAALGLQHVDVNGRVLAVLLMAEIAIIAVFAVSNLAHPAGGVVAVDALAPGTLFGPGVGALFALAVLGFVGFEASVVFSEEARDRRRTVPIATYLSVALIGTLYAVASWAMQVATGPDRIVEASRTHGTELLFTLARSQLGGTIAAIGNALLVTSILAAAISFHNTSSRYMFALGRERVLPAALSRTRSRSGAPLVGSLLQSGIGLAVILTYAVAGWDPVVRLFYWAGTFGGVGVLLLITVTSVAVVVFFRRHPGAEHPWRRWIAPVLAGLALLVVSGLALSNLTTLLGVPEDSVLRWVVPGVYLAAAMLGVGWGLTLRARRPAVYAVIGQGAKATLAGEPGSLGNGGRDDAVR